MAVMLQGKIALVTGGLSGIGLAIAERFVREGAQVIAADLSTEATALDDSNMAPLQMNVADEASTQSGIDKIIAKYGRLDCVVNSAGIGNDIPFLDTPLELFDKIIAVNLRGTFIVGQAAARAMVKTGGGAICNIASVSGMTGNVGRSAYGASKGGVVVLSKVMAVDLAAQNVRVNVLSPGPVETPLVAKMHNDFIRKRWIERTPMARYASPEEMTGGAVFLCSDDAGYVTGHVLAIDGGMMGSGLTAA